MTTVKSAHFYELILETACALRVLISYLLASALILNVQT